MIHHAKIDTTSKWMQTASVLIVTVIVMGAGL